MIRVVMFDFGLTLIDDARQPFPHVEEALKAISALKTVDGKPLRRCLVSDFTMAPPPVTAAKISSLFKEHLAILDATGLRPFFEPVAKRVTLSTHAGVFKPDRKVFEKALSRLGASVPLQDCLFITENESHIKAARETLQMQALQFRSPDSETFDFDDWAQAPALIAGLVAPQQPANIHAPVKAKPAGQGVDLMKPKSTKVSGKKKGTDPVWRTVSVPEDKNVGDVQVAIPVEEKKTRGTKGKGVATAKGEPSAEHIAEATAFARSLAKHGQIAGGSEKSLTGTTHEIETDEKGDRRLVRKRFNAF